MGVPVWSHDGIICIGEALKNAVRLTFPKGAQMKDPKKLFNTRLESNTVRAIDFHEGDTIDEAALKALILEAVRLNISKVHGEKKAASSKTWLTTGGSSVGMRRSRLYLDLTQEIFLEDFQASPQTGKREVRRTTWPHGFTRRHDPETELMERKATAKHMYAAIDLHQKNCSTRTEG